MRKLEASLMEKI